jgi:hypothetical protein
VDRPTPDEQKSVVHSKLRRPEQTPAPIAA